jgi:hypothetical protein
MKGSDLLTREAVLANANELINGDRAQMYGDAAVAHDRIAQVWSVLIGTEINAHQVCLLLAAMKMVRAAVNPEYTDSWIDMAGYAALGAEIVSRTNE